MVLLLCPVVREKSIAWWGETWHARTSAVWSDDLTSVGHTAKVSCPGRPRQLTHDDLHTQAVVIFATSQEMTLGRTPVVVVESAQNRQCHQLTFVGRSLAQLWPRIWDGMRRL